MTPRSQKQQRHMEAKFSQIREVRVSYHTPQVDRRQFTAPRHVSQFVREVLTDNSREHFIAVYLDGSHKPISYSIISIGLANFCAVHPREIFQRAIMSGACAMIVAHNHPSGSLEASKEDWEMTHRLQEAAKLLGIKLLDHVIINDTESVSLAEDWRWKKA